MKIPIKGNVDDAMSAAPVFASNGSPTTDRSRRAVRSQTGGPNSDVLDVARRPGAHPAPARLLGIEDRYMTVRVLAAYSGMSVRTLRSHLSRTSRPLPHYRVGGKVLVKQSEFDEWMAGFRVDGSG